MTEMPYGRMYGRNSSSRLLSGPENYKISDLTEKAFPVPPWLLLEWPLLVFVELLEGISLKPTLLSFIYFLEIVTMVKTLNIKASPP